MQLLTAVALLLAIALPQGAQPGYDAVKAEAERAHAEGSYSRALEAYRRAAPLAPTPAERRWVDFRTADSLWRSRAATDTGDTTELDSARTALEALGRDPARPADRDPVWAEAHESLGDWHWSRRQSRNWGGAWPHYASALDWWAGQSDLESARARYLRIIWKASEPAGGQDYEVYGYHGILPLDVVENAARIARTPADRSRAQYLLGVTLTRSGNWEQSARAPEAFEAALREGAGARWYDDALFGYAELLTQYGVPVTGEDGNWRREHDYEKGLALYRRIVEIGKGRTRYHDQAAHRITEITRPQVSVSVPDAFLPGSEMGFALNWRNVTRVDLGLYPIDLSADPRATMSSQTGWLPEIDLAGRVPAMAWAKEVSAEGHKPGNETVSLDRPLAPGAYVLEAKAGGVASRDLLIVTDATLVLKTSPRAALVYLADLRTGAPIAGARVGVVALRWYDNAPIPQRLEAVTGPDGVARLEIVSPSSYQLFAGAALGARQAFAIAGRNALNEEASWKVYAFTDRPAYRPGDTVQWKLVARTHDGSGYATPAGQSLEYEVRSPQGAKVSEGRAALNAFGGAWGSLELAQAFPLGEYQVQFWTEGRQRHIGQAVLFRLEEYKLPEFRVSVRAPEVDGRRRAFRTGERVEVVIEAEYYFGGPVAGATVEAIVHQSPYYRRWKPARELDWFTEQDRVAYDPYAGQRQVVKRETLATDATGRARLVFDTPRGAQTDLEYVVEARVVDASRREVVSSDRVRVARQRFYADLTPDHNIFRPGDAVRVKLTTLDANDQPVAATGTAKVTRDVWTEVWVDAAGRAVKPEVLRRLKARRAPVPAGWRIASQRYERTEVHRATVATDAKGEGELSFVADREGFYTVEWAASEDRAAPVRGSTAVRVATEATTDLGYRTGGLEIVVDRDTLRTGHPAPVMIHTPQSGRWVLFTVEGTELIDYRVVRVEGTGKLISIDVDDRHVPNAWLTAITVADLQHAGTVKEVTVPPVRNFLTVDVRADRAVYRPREEGVLEVTTRDADGRPVAAEVALGFTDESVYAIQEDYAADPRKFFFGNRRPHLVQSATTAQYKSPQDLVRDEAGQLLDRRQAEGRRVFAKTETWAALGLSRDAVGARDNDPFFKPEPAAAQPTEVVSEYAVVPKNRADGAGDAGSSVVVRSDFRATAFWKPDVVTDASGRATVRVTLPDSLTTWRAVARAATAAAQFGQATSTARTNQPLNVRLQAPRFFVVGDRVTISAVLDNNTDAPFEVRPTIQAEGLDPRPTRTAATTAVPARGEARVDWTAEVVKAGPVKVRVAAEGGGAADAMERELVAYEHGIDKLVARSGKARTGDAAFALELPAARKAGTTSLVVQVAPSMAVTMLDALPYLIDYPYGCTEQTMSRFLPTVITAKTLRDLGVSTATVETRLFGGVEPGSAVATHPRGRRDLDRIGEMTKAGLGRLYDFQHEDGGWGWWKKGESDHFMSGYVVWGLALARQAGVEVDESRFDRALEFLEKEVVEEEMNLDLQAWMLHALAVARAGQDEPSEAERTAFENLWEKRDGLNAWSRALLALAAQGYGRLDEARVLTRNLENGAVVDRAPDRTAIEPRANRGESTAQATAHWGTDGIAWRWSDSAVESTAFVLRALLAISPESPLVEPATNWLVRNRRGAQWSSTRDTAIAVLALNDYLKVSGELAAGLDVEVHVNGTPVGARAISASEAIAAPMRIAVDPSLVRDGSNEIRVVRRGGTAPIYWAAEARFVSTEEPIAPAGNELFVRREYFKLVPRETLLKGFVHERVPLGETAALASGDRVEVVLTVEAKNDLEYTMFEDLKPAGLEAVDVRSGGEFHARQLKSGALDRTGARGEEDYTGERRWAHRELRDRKVAIFVDRMAQGVWEFRYELRAEVPGEFHGLPLIGQAMYVPEIRANGAEARLTVREAESSRGGPGR